MRVEYKKEWMETYLWVLPDKSVEINFEEQMLNCNPGGGRLDFFRQEQDGEEYFCYKVTGKKALNSIYAVMPIGERQIRALLGQLFAVLEDGRELLLSEENFVLSPGYIFATFPQMVYEFCYVPGYGVPLRQQLEGLFEYLLNRVDYEDKPAVDLLYDCYMFCMREKGGLAEIKKLLAKDIKEYPVHANRVQQKKPETAEKPEREKTEEYPEKKAAPASYVSWLTDKLFSWRKREPALVAEGQEEYRAESGRRTAGTTMQVQPEHLPMEDSERTVLLSQSSKPSQPELICEQTGEVVVLTKFPFYIGCAGEYADFVPAAEGVSRIHCCISKKEDNYYLSDLNSTNGTYLNGKEVAPGKDMLLSEGDEIRVSSQEFYMKLPCH